MVGDQFRIWGIRAEAADLVLYTVGSTVYRTCAAGNRQKRAAFGAVGTGRHALFDDGQSLLACQGFEQDRQFPLRQTLRNGFVDQLVGVGDAVHGVSVPWRH